MSQNSDPRSSQNLPHAIGKWQPTTCLGEGNWSRVYQVRPLELSPTGPADYALKQLRPELTNDPIARNVLAREIAIGQRVSHPNLSPVLDTGISHQQPFLVMPLLSGCSLQHLASAAHPLAVPQSLWFLRQVSQGIVALHQEGWIHADIKPANVIVAADGHATLIDFGLARRIAADDRDTPCPFVGTLTYAAPEMISPVREIDCQADVYSLGVTAYEVLTGKTPFWNVPLQDLPAAHLRETPPSARRWVPALHREINELLLAMLAKQPVHRPTMQEVIASLVRLEVETLAERPPWYGPQPGTPSRERVA